MNIPTTIPTTISSLIECAYSNWNDAELLGRIGTELESRSRLDVARRVLERALVLNPLHHPEWYLSLAFAYFRDTSGNYSADGERTLVEGIEETDSDYLKASYLSLFEENDIAEIIEDLRISSDVSVRFALGQSLLWRGDVEAARTLLRETVQTLDEHETPLGLDAYCVAMNWMRAQEGEGKSTINLYEEVLPYLTRLMRSAPEVYNPYALTIQMYQIAHEYEKVCEVALETLRVFPDEETTMLALAIGHERLGNDGAALLWYNRAIGAKPSFVRARVLLGKLYERLNHLQLAEQVFREMIAANPAYHQGKIELAYFLRRIGKHSEASSLFRYAYDRLQSFEKATVASHSDGKIMLDEIHSLDLPIITN